MSAQDDELIRRYREASEDEGARPGAHVRSAVRAHAQMLTAAENTPAETVQVVEKRSNASNASRWKISMLGSVTLIGLTGLLMLQFERGTSKEKEAAYGKGRAEMSVPVESPAAVPESASVATDIAASAKTAPQETSTDRTSVQDRLRKNSAPLPPAPAKSVANGALPAGRSAPPAAQAEPAMAESQEKSLNDFPASSEASAGARALRAYPVPPTPAQSVDASPPAAAGPDTSVLAQPIEGRRSSVLSGADRRAALETDLWQAAQKGHALQLEKIVGQGAPVNARDSVGRTALMLAAINGQTTAVQKLLALGADPTLLDRDGLSAAQQARRMGHARTADVIEAGR